MRRAGRKNKQRKAKTGRTAPAERIDAVKRLQADFDDLELQNQSLIQAHRELEASREKYADLFDTAPVCMVSFDSSGLIRELNLPGGELLRRSRQLMGCPFGSLVARDDKKKFWDHLLRCRKSKGETRQFSVELQIDRKPPLDPLYIELVTVSPVDRKRDHLFKSAFRDVTELKRLQELYRWLAAIVESSEHAIIGMDLDGKIVSCNRGVTHLYGYDTEELVGNSIRAIVPEALQHELTGMLAALRKGERIEHQETVAQHKDGSHIDVSLTLSPVCNKGGRIIGASNIARNISERKRVEKELAQTLARERAANRAKDDFLAALSHELRTPLNPVLLLASDAVQNRELSEPVRADFDTIRKNIELEARLIDDLLDLTRITRGKTVLNRNELSIHAILKDALETVENDMRQKMLALQLNLTAKRQTVFGDAVRLQQVFWNVLKNAIKFTHEGGAITVGTHVIEDGRISVSIADTGIGMAEGEIGRVFDAFAQGSHPFGGLGLGLAISRALVELHGGTIRAESRGKDTGATFTVELPLLQVAEKSDAEEPLASPAAGESSPGSHVRVLLVEDHEPTRVTLTRLLRRRQYEVAGAGSAAEARSLVKNADAEFQLIISDIGLPDGNGYDLMKELKGDSNLKGIALTGYGSEDDVIRSQEAGFTTHLTKPVRVETLDRALAAALRHG